MVRPRMSMGTSPSQTLTRQLRQHIASGGLKPGDSLPAERTLALQYRVSRPTVRTALLTLAHEGILVRSRGRGSVVADGTTGKELSGQQILLCYALPRDRPAENDAFLAILTATLAALPGGVRLHRVDPDDPEPITLPAQVGGGIIFGGLRAPDDAVLRQVAERGLPAVLIGERTSSIPIPEIRADHRRSGEMAAQHLLAHGHRRIVLVDGPADHHPCRLTPT